MSTRRLGRGLRALLLAACALPAPILAPDARAACPAAGTWALATDGGSGGRSLRQVLDTVRPSRVVLLGEHHDDMEHHRWQLGTLAALQGGSDEVVLGLEMFPRDSQAALDRWVAGELSEKAFLAESRWQAVWHFDPALYSPIFHFARQNRIPMRALNIDASLTREVSRRGFAEVTALRDLGITRPAAPAPAYLDFLAEGYAQHGPRDGETTADVRESPGFRRFVESQLTWDRAMAQGIRDALLARPGARVVALMGSGHVINGWGVEAQLRDLGIDDVVSMLPSDAVPDCEAAGPWPATAVFGIGEFRDPEPVRPRLGVWLERRDGGVTIRRVEPGSVAEAAGLQADDVVVAVGGQAADSVEDVIGRIAVQAPGSWLPLRVRRSGAEMEVVARFPPPTSP